MVLSGWEIEAKVTEASGNALRFAIEIGNRKPLHSLAAGKAILAALPESTLTQYFAEVERVRFTDATLVEEPDIRAELERIRARGFAEANEEDQIGVIGFACGIEYGAYGFGAVAMAIPTVRYDEKIKNLTVTKLKNIADQLVCKKML